MRGSDVHGAITNEALVAFQKNPMCPTSTPLFGSKMRSWGQTESGFTCGTETITGRFCVKPGLRVNRPSGVKGDRLVACHSIIKICEG